MSLLTVSEVGANIRALGNLRKDIPITPGFRCRTLASGGVINAVYDVVYLVLDYFQGNEEGLRQQHLKQTLVATQFSFNQAYQTICDTHSRYHAYLRAIEKGSETYSKEFYQCKRHISAWNAAMTPVDGSSMQELITQANNGFSNLSKGEDDGWLETIFSTPFIHSDVMEQVRRAQHLIDLEDTVSVPLPLGSLHKLTSNCKTLGVEEKQALKKWIDKVNGSWHMDSQKMHLGLKSLCQYWGLSTACTAHSPSALAYLEYHLQRQGLKVLDKPSIKHLRWREQVEKCKEVDIQGKKYQLDRRLGQHRSGHAGDDKHRVFSLKRDDSRVLVIGESEASLLIEQAAAKEESLGIPLVQLRKMDASGNCALVERLHRALAGDHWQSGNQEIHANDHAGIASLADFLRLLMSKDETPLVSVGDLMFTANGELRLLRGVPEGDCFDFDRLVHLAKEAAGTSPAVFKKLLNDSGLVKHPLVKMYTEVVEDSFSDDPKPVDVIAAKHEVSATKPRQTAKTLRRDLVAMRNACVTDYIQNYVLPEGVTNKEVEAYFNQPIIQRYKETIGAGQIWKTSCVEIVEPVAAEKGVTKK